MIKIAIPLRLGNQRQSIGLRRFGDIKPIQLPTTFWTAISGAQVHAGPIEPGALSTRKNSATALLRLRTRTLIGGCWISDVHPLNCKLVADLLTFRQVEPILSLNFQRLQMPAHKRLLGTIRHMTVNSALGGILAEVSYARCRVKGGRLVGETPQRR